ncbi:MAG: peptidylprolyl isomerase [Actinobacteria bacterium]|nr:peptidylprolyl isomerase [Actinomycetota bacterium]
MKVEHGTVVSLLYTLTDDEGTILDSTAGGEPLDYLHGYRNIIVGLEEALDGVEAGFQTQVTVQPDKGYGEVDTSAVFAVPIDQFPTDMELEAGMTVVGELQDGPVRFTVREVRDQEREVVLDGNHPLAGMTLHFAVEVVGVRAATDAEAAQGYPVPRVV